MTTERDWVDEQLASLPMDLEQKTAVRNMLNGFWSQRDGRRLDATQVEEVLSVFNKLARRQPVAAERPTEEVWVPAKTGAIFMRDTVRVREDAYDSDPGFLHNGRVGVVVGIRPDDIRVRYTDGKDAPPYVRHRTSALEKRIK